LLGLFLSAFVLEFLSLPSAKITQLVYCALGRIGRLVWERHFQTIFAHVSRRTEIWLISDDQEEKGQIKTIYPVLGSHFS
jgi:hypothetical protein